MRLVAPTERPCLAAALAAAAFILAACPAAPPPPDTLSLTPVRFAGLPGWRDDSHAAAVPALKRSCDRLSRLPGEWALEPGDIGGIAADWRAPCAAAAALVEGDDAAARAFFEHWFTPLKAANGEESTGLFTGYYEAELRGARRPGGRYTVPVYGRPSDLVAVDLGLFDEVWTGRRIAGRVVDGALRPYDTRAEIEAGALQGQGVELVWVDDFIDAFLLHIQGSGRVFLEDGSVMRVGFAGSNGHPFHAIGRELVRTGQLSREEVSMPSILDWLRAHPDEARALMATNPRYIFFRELEGEGPIGAQGVALTPGRSLAVDPAFIPFGVPIWLDTTWPGAPDRPLRRLMVAQDAGFAIRGPVRGDVFWGYGEEAMGRAGRMDQAGEYYLLLPRGVSGSSNGS